MRLLLCAGLSAVLFSSSSCIAVNNQVKRPDQNSNAVRRIKSFTKSMTKTATEVSSDVLPILTAVGNELLVEAKSELPKVAGELQSQMTHLSSFRKSRPSSP